MGHKLIIPKGKANDEIKAYLSYRDEATNEAAFTGLSKAAQTYYSSNEVSFVFKKEELDELFKDINANGFRVYYGAHPDDGMPTLVVVPCFVSGKDNETIKNVIKSDSNAAQEYPTSFKANGKKLTFDIAHDDVS